jgi:hypothetical protein
MPNNAIKFIGFSEALNDASEHLSKKLDKSLDFADNMYMTHGQDAVDAVNGYTDKDVAREYATNFIINQMEDEDEE